MPEGIYKHPKIPLKVKYEIERYKVRIFDENGQRVGSVDVQAIGLETARVVDLNLVYPYLKPTKQLISLIRWFLKYNCGYKYIVFERAKGDHFLDRRQTL